MSAKTLAVGTAAIVFLAVTPFQRAAAQDVDFEVEDVDLDERDIDVEDVEFEVRDVELEVRDVDRAPLSVDHAEVIQALEECENPQVTQVAFTGPAPGIRPVATDPVLMTTEQHALRYRTTTGFTHEQFALIEPELQRHRALGGDLVTVHTGLEMAHAAGCVDAECQLALAQTYNRALEWGIPIETVNGITAGVIAEKESPRAGDYDDFIQHLNLRLSHQYALWAQDHPPQVVEVALAPQTTQIRRVSYECE